MLRPSLKCLSWAFPIILFGPATAWADRLELLTGDVFTGRVLRVTDHEASIQLEGGGIVTFNLSGVRSIRKGSHLGDDSQLIFESSRAGRRPHDDGERPQAFPPLPVVPPGDGLPGAIPVSPSNGDPGQPTDPRLPAGGGSPSTDRVAVVEFGRGFESPRSLVAFKDFGFAVAPPEGFVAWPEAQSATLPLATRDPVTLTSFTVATYPSGDGVDRVRKNAMRAYTEQFRIFHVLRDEELGKLATGEPRAWLIEMESRVAMVSIHQIQIFTRTRAGAVVLTYSATQDTYPRFRDAFTKSIGTFRFTQGLDPTRSAPAGEEPTYPPILRSAPEPQHP